MKISFPFHRKQKKKATLATRILIGMSLGIIAGLLTKLLPPVYFINTYIVGGLFEIGGEIFLNLFKMLVVPIIFVTIICGIAGLGSNEKLGRLGFKTMLLFIASTMIAITISLSLAYIFNLGSNGQTPLATSSPITTPLTLKQLLLNIVPSNPVQALAQGNMLQIIVFAILIGIAITMAGSRGKHIAELFQNFNAVLLKLIDVVLKFAPYGVFCLLASVVNQLGIQIIGSLANYILVVLLALSIQFFVIYSILLVVIAKLNPLYFFKKMHAPLLFAFSTTSSNATIPINLETTEKKMGVKNSIASFIIPLGANINLNGSAITQATAAILVAHLYHINLSLTSYFIIFAMVTLTSMSSAGIPSACIFTLAVVFQQAGLPMAGIGLVFGVDRIVDMFRTPINISGDVVTALIVGKSEKEFDEKIYRNGVIT